MAAQNDGGWALDGNATDVDMTAMAIQALAPYYNKSNKTVKDAVDTALAWLSTKQNSDGGFSSWGKANLPHRSLSRCLRSISMRMIQTAAS